MVRIPPAFLKAAMADSSFDFSLWYKTTDLFIYIRNIVPKQEGGFDSMEDKVSNLERENVTEIQRSCQFPNIAFDCFGLLKIPGKNLASFEGNLERGRLFCFLP